MKYFCVISHTHWDREWYMPLELFKLKLVDLIDRLLVTLEEYPEYIFHLDAQTIVLEDYLEYRPSKKDTLKKLIKEGRLVVGPWYLQNDFYLTSGESTIRNLIEGQKIAEEFGKCGKVGYVPDQFGNISQLPQILNNFGIKSFVFGRGFCDYDVSENGEVQRKTTPSEFIWQGADGSKLLAVHMPFWYNNAQRFSENIETSKLLLECIEKQFEGVAITPYLLLMNGVDHLEAQDNLLPILEKLQGEFNVRQYHMEEYIDSLEKYISENNVDIKTYKGELRKGEDLNLLKGTLSSRTYLKTSNVLIQNMIECKLEPVYSMLQLYGANDKTYSLDHFRYMWKNLIKNHPHDSICGCSRDEVHKHMEDNYSRLSEVTEEMLNRALREIAEHADLALENRDDYIIIAVNPTDKPQNGVIQTVIDIPLAEGIEAFTILDSDGNTVEYDVISKEKASKDLFSPLNLPGVLEVLRYKVYLYCEEVKAFSVKSFIVKKAENTKDFLNLKENASTVLENDFIKAFVQKNGAVSLLDKKSGWLFDDILDIEETADNGDSYVFGKTDDKAIYGSAFEAEVAVLEKNKYIQKVKISRNLVVPECYEFKNRKRSDKKVVCKVDLILTLKKGSELLEVEYTVDNKAKDHRIRLLLNTGIDTEISTADIPFDIISSSINDSYPTTMSKVFPNTSFALLEDSKGGIAAFTEGTHEYEHINERKALAFTLVRSTGSIVRALDSLDQIGGSQWDCPENQCIRTLQGRLGLKPYLGNYVSAKIPLAAKQFRNNLLSYFTSCDRKKFSGGRTAVQDTRLSELFYLKDENSHLKIPNNIPAFEVTGEGVVVTALKKAEDENGFILRLLNYSNDISAVSIKVKAEIILTDMAETKNTALGKNEVNLDIASKEIATLRII